jgi:hypothetical protein
MPFREHVTWTDDGFMHLRGTVGACWKGFAASAVITVLSLVVSVAIRSPRMLAAAVLTGGLSAVLWIALRAVRPRLVTCDVCGRSTEVEVRGDGIRHPLGWRVVARGQLNRAEVAFHELYCDRCTPWARHRSSRS